LDQKEDVVFVVIKWVSAGLLAGFAWLVRGYAMEYFKPYQRVGIRVRNRKE
jgi:hypothetical protein